MTALLTVSLLAACSKVERHPDLTVQEIALYPLGSSMTRAEGDFNEDAVLGVYAYHADDQNQAQTPWNAVWAGASEYLNDVPFALKNGYWVGKDESYYWPSAGFLMFAGYAPHQDYSEGTIEKVEFASHEYDGNPYLVIDFTQNTVLDRMVDLLWFDVKDVASGYAVAKTADAVPITFKHALAKVSFNFTDDAQRYKLKSVKLQGCINSSKFYSGNTAGWLPDVEHITEVEEYKLLEVSGDAQAPILNGWGTDKSMYVIPQYLDGIFPVLGGTADKEVDVVLEFELTEGFAGQTIQIPLKDYTAHWDMGKHYVYAIEVNANPIEFGKLDVVVLPQVNLM